MMITRSSFILLITLASSVESFSPGWTTQRNAALLAKGFGGGGSGGGFGASKPGKKKKKQQGSRLVDTLNDKNKGPSAKKKKKGTTYNKNEQDQMLEELAASSSRTAIGQAVASSPMAGSPDADPFWELMPSLISSRFPNVRDDQLQRIAGFVRHTLDPNLPLEDDIVSNPHRPHQEIHAYMPNLGDAKPFHDPDQLKLCKLMSENYETIKEEYHALLKDMESSGNDRFQSVTSMNYEAGWKTVVLFYNGHRIPDFPYHLCPVTTKILETVPIAGRIAGFNRQKPLTGIPLHSDGNNMWLTCQMGIHVPEGEKAHIRVGPETRHWKEGECLLYDTTFEHETMNASSDEERVVLHVDFFNTIAMTPVEIEIMQYIYSLREEFMKAEGVAKVGAQVL